MPLTRAMSSFISGNEYFFQKEQDTADYQYTYKQRKQDFSPRDGQDISKKVTEQVNRVFPREAARESHNRSLIFYIKSIEIIDKN